MDRETRRFCPECEEPITRRELLKAAGGVVAATVAGAAAGALPASARPRPPQTAKAQPQDTPESLVKTLYNTLTAKQKEVVALPWGDPKRKRVAANWAIVEPTIGDFFTPEQQEIVRAIFRGVTNEAFYPKFLEQMRCDGAGFENYHVAIFGDPNSERAEWVLTGRHMTIRAGGDPTVGAFGGPIFYGHAPEFNEKPDHPGNVFWYQAKRANEVYQMLDGKQRKQALIALAPVESAIQFRREGEPLPGVPIASLSRDQKAHVQRVMHDVLAPYRQTDVEEALRDVQASGGLEAMHLAFYKQEDLGSDGIWDIWRLEGPAFVWHFRGAPHVHVWVNVGRRGKSGA